MSSPSSWFRQIVMALLGGVMMGVAPADATEPDWSLYKAVLQRHVSPQTRKATVLNWVNYTALKKDPDLATTVRMLAEFPVATLSGPKEKLSFHINAYNILALNMVAEHWPLESIKDVGSIISPVWKKDAGSIGGTKVTLDQVEHEILRPMGDPRMHMAIVCASISCPDLRREPYVAAQLDQQLDDQARGFLANSAKGLRLEGGTVKVSRIFSWFADDFAKQGGVSGFLQHYRQNLPQTMNIEADLPYDWSVNGE
ncbi:MAG: DUF547 domain-containing protein [Magnetococcales bacterium]|nr:DUF547 domain-containing protein [Magnetococcales bacterium]